MKIVHTGGGNQECAANISLVSSCPDDGSNIWLPYLTHADQFDKEVVEGWRDDMDSLLIFAALYSAIVTAFAVDSYKYLQPDIAGETLNALIQISQQALQSSNTSSEIRTQVFTPSTPYIIVNILYFLSISFSVTCALAAVMVKQWARHYLRAPRSLHSTSERARMRQILFENLESWKFEIVVEVIPALLHISLALSSTGVVLFLYLTNAVVATFVLITVALASTAYAFLTICPLFYPACPYRTPLSRLPPIIHHFLFSIGSHAGTVISVAYFTILRQILRFWSSCRRASLTSLATDQVRSRDLHHSVRLAVTKARQEFHSTAYFNMTSGIQERRRQLARDHSIMYDEHALQWVLGISTSRNDLITIVQALPQFIKSHASSDYSNFQYRGMDIGPGLFMAQSVLWRAGVPQRVVNLMHTCIEHCAVKQEDFSLALSCIAALHWLTRCPATFYGSDGRSEPPIDAQSTGKEFPVHGILQINFIIKSPDNLAHMWRGTLVNIVFHHICRLETMICNNDKSENSGQRYREALKLLKSLEINASILRRSVNAEEKSTSWSRIIVLLNSISAILPEKQSTHEFEVLEKILKSIEALRVRWAERTLEYAMDPAQTKISDPPSSESIFFNQLCDAITHIPSAPLSSRECQLLAFQLLDRALRLQDQWQGDGEMVSDAIPGVVRTSYAKVLFGENGQTSERCHGRSHLLASFFDRVQVCSTRSVDQKYYSADSSVHVHIADYVAILDRLSASLDGSGCLSHDISEPGFELEDIFAKAVHDFICCRILAPHDETTSSVRISEPDTKAAQTMRIFAQKHPNVSALASLNTLILRTASQHCGS